MPIKELANRTAWLKSQIGLVSRLEDEVILTGSTPIPGTLAGHLIVVYATSITTLPLDNAATFPHGAIIPFTAFCTPGNVVNITTAQNFFDPVSGVSTVIHMHNKETLILIALTDHFKVLSATGNFYCVGEEVKARKVLNNTLAFTGQLVQRSQYPRLTKYVLNELILGQEVTNEATYFSHPLNYRGLFTTGDGLTTMRLPDERGLSERMLDLGRGVDIFRVHNYAGGYEADAVGPANIITEGWTGASMGKNGLPTNTAGFLLTNGDGGVVKSNTASGVNRPLARTPYFKVDGTETITKNIGKLNLIKF